MDQYLTSTCSVSDGDLPLSIRWSFNGEPIANNDASDAERSVTPMGRRSSVLTIESVAARHAGRYECRAENAAGSASWATELKVIGWFALKYIHSCIQRERKVPRFYD